MRLPRVRFTVRRMMVAVAVAAVGSYALPIALRAPNHFRRARYMSGLHAGRVAVNLQLVATTERSLRQWEAVLARETGPVYTSGAPSREAVERYRRSAGDHDRMRRHWDRVAWRPWRSMRTELRYDVNEQD